MNKKYYTEIKKDIIPSKDRMNWTDWRKLNYEFFKNFDYKNKKVLDLGAGKGHFRELFKDSDYTSVDFYPYENIDIVADLTKTLPFETETADYIILSNVLEHISTPRELLRECHRILRNDGKLLITVPFFIKLHQQPYDFYRYTEYALKDLLSDFNDVEIRKLGTISDIHKGILKDLFGLKSRLLKPVYYLVKFLTDFEADHRNYPEGYSVMARKSKELS